MPLDPASFTASCSTIATRAGIAATDASILLPHVPPLRKVHRVLVRNIGDLSRTSSYATIAPPHLPLHAKLIEPIVDLIPRRLEQTEAALAVMDRQFLRAFSGIGAVKVELDEDVLLGYEEFLQAQFALITAYSKALRMRKPFPDPSEVPYLQKAIDDFDRTYARVMRQDDILGVPNTTTTSSAANSTPSSYPPEKVGLGPQTREPSPPNGHSPGADAPVELAATNPATMFELPGSSCAPTYELSGTTPHCGPNYELPGPTPQRPSELPGATPQPNTEIPRNSPSPETPATVASSPKAHGKPKSSSFMSSLGHKFKALAASVTPKTPPYITALCAAAAANDTNQIQSLLNLATTPTPTNPNPAPLNLNARSETGETPLTSACAAGSFSAASLLLNHGADSKTTNARNIPPLYLNDSPELTRLLLTHGADPNTRKETFFAAAVLKAATADSTGRTTQSGADELTTLRLLLKHGADPATVDVSVRSVLCNAVRAGSLEVVQLLLGHGAAPSVGDAMGLPLVGALLYPDGATAIAIATLLVRHGASAGPEVRCYRTARGVIQLCVERSDAGDGGRTAARLLGVILNAGAEPAHGERDLLGEKIWWRLAKGCEAEKLDARERALRLTRAYLESTVVDLNEKFGIGPGVIQTPLEFAMERGLWGLFALLIKAGASVSSQEPGRDGVTLGEAVKLGEGVLALLDGEEPASQTSPAPQAKEVVPVPEMDDSQAGSSVADGFRGPERSVSAVPPPPGPPPGRAPLPEDESDDAPPPYESLPSR